MLVSLLGLLLPLGHAFPDSGRHRNSGHDCISDKEAEALLNQYITLFEHLDVNLAERILTPNFQLTSSSLNFLLAMDVRRSSYESIVACTAVRVNLFISIVTSSSRSYLCLVVYEHV